MSLPELPLFPEDKDWPAPRLHAQAVASALVMMKQAGPAAFPYPPSIYAQVVTKLEDAVAYLEEIERRRAAREAEVRAKAHKGEARR